VVVELYSGKFNVAYCRDPELKLPTPFTNDDIITIILNPKPLYLYTNCQIAREAKDGSGNWKLEQNNKNKKLWRNKKK
jgi:hypothetical protein